MDIQPACYACVLNQIIDASARIHLDTETQYTLINNALQYLLNVSPRTSLPEVGQYVHRMIRSYSGEPDPYLREKITFNKKLLELLPSIRASVNKSDDPLKSAIRYAIARNVIDFALIRDGQIELQQELDRAATNPIHVDHSDRFKRSLLQAQSIVYLADNAGEIVMDRLLIEVIRDNYGKDITLIVRGNPVLNDATLSDAHQVGLDKVATVLPNGNDAPGTLYEEVTPEVKNLLNNADIIIAKGQGNFESLSDYSLPVYFLFKVKCEVVAGRIEVPVNSYVLASSQLIPKKD